MAASLDFRIQWLHKQIFDERYPNAFRIAEKFSISHRQAQRDIEYLREKMKAPLAYDRSKKGFYYTAPFSLPSYSTTANDEDYTELLSRIRATREEDVGESETLQMQIPYTAEIGISSKLGMLELKDFIVARKAKNILECEFNNIDLFLGLIFTLSADVRILSPEWLREKAVSGAQLILRNNGSENGLRKKRNGND